MSVHNITCHKCKAVLTFQVVAGEFDPIVLSGWYFSELGPMCPDCCFNEVAGARSAPVEGMVPDTGASGSFFIDDVMDPKRPLRDFDKHPHPIYQNAYSAFSFYTGLGYSDQIMLRAINDILLLIEAGSERTLVASTGDREDEDEADQPHPTSAEDEGSDDVRAGQRPGGPGSLQAPDGSAAADSRAERTGPGRNRRADETVGPESRSVFRAQAEELGTSRINSIVHAFDRLVDARDKKIHPDLIRSASEQLKLAITHAMGDLPELVGVTR